MTITKGETKNGIPGLFQRGICYCCKLSLKG
nr:MAG TPA: hypothetical protein [Microviridae sp.]